MDVRVHALASVCPWTRQGSIPRWGLSALLLVQAVVDLGTVSRVLPSGTVTLWLWSNRAYRQIPRQHAKSHLGFPSSRGNGSRRQLRGTALTPPTSSSIACLLINPSTPRKPRAVTWQRICRRENSVSASQGDYFVKKGSPAAGVSSLRPRAGQSPRWDTSGSWTLIAIFRHHLSILGSPLILRHCWL